MYQSHSPFGELDSNRHGEGVNLEELTRFKQLSYPHRKHGKKHCPCCVVARVRAGFVQQLTNVQINLK